ncbi:MAG: type III-B CRISPR module RAMP protein Cmr4 [Chloroflexota bacterium]
MKTGLLFFYTESPMHAGTGSGLSAIDLPIQRERSTQYPNIHGSGVKGALRSQCAAPSGEIEAIFGPETTNKGTEYAGAISLGEARIVLFPVRSLVGVFAYVTCPHVISRLARDAKVTDPKVKFSITVADEKSSLVTTNSAITINNAVVLDEFSFDAKPSKEVDALAKWLVDNALPDTTDYQYWQDKLKDSLIVLPDNAFRDFVVNATEIATRVKIRSESKTVQAGALWTQEALPADTLMVSAVTTRTLRGDTGLPSGKDDAAAVAWLKANFKDRIQIGGDETVGQGLVSLRWQIN